MATIQQLFDIAKRKFDFDQNHDWSDGSTTYLAEMKKEIDEVLEELPKSRQLYLEEELGDVLWDYLNVLVALQQEQGIEFDKVIERACRKYEQRVSGVVSGESWSSVKARQKVELAREQSEFVQLNEV